MAKEKKEKIKNLTRVYRFVVIDDMSHQNLFIFRGTRLFFTLSAITIFFVFLVSITLIISFTPIKQLIPGYPSSESRKAAIQNVTKVDSLERELQLWTLQLTNIQRIVTGQEPIVIDSLLRDNSGTTAKIAYSNNYSKEDSILRSRVMDYDKFNLSSKNVKIEQIEGLLFFPPVKGLITEHYNKAIGHPFVDIATKEDAIVVSVLDGTVIAEFWTDETGYNIQVQHGNNLVSIYKHNVKLLKKTGDKVKAGTAISFAGNIGILSTGPHLHFELWHKGEAINPTKYIKF